MFFFSCSRELFTTAVEIHSPAVSKYLRRTLLVPPRVQSDTRVTHLQRYAASLPGCAVPATLTSSQRRLHYSCRLYTIFSSFLWLYGSSRTSTHPTLFSAVYEKRQAGGREHTDTRASVNTERATAIMTSERATT